MDNKALEFHAQATVIVGHDHATLGIAAEHATLDDLIRHIDHIVELVGIDYVGLGSDFAEVELVGLVTDEYSEDTRMGMFSRSWVRTCFRSIGR